MDEKEILKSLENELIDYKDKIDNIKKVNRKIKIKKLARKSIIVTKICIPFVICSALCTGGTTLLHANPFIEEDEKVYLYYEEAKDNLGNYTKTETYQEIVKNKLVTVYGDWTYTDGLYQREITEYYGTNLEVDDLEEILNNPELINNLIVKNIKTVTTNNISNLDESRIEYKIIGSDETQYILLPESTNKKVLDTIMYIIIVALLEVITGVETTSFRNKQSNLWAKLETLDKYKPLDLNEVKNLYTLALNNYERMTNYEESGNKKYTK